MKVETLISCMRQKDASIASRSNVKTDCVIVNQCDTDSSATLPYTDADGNTHILKYISTTERGLSRSRNMAIKNSTGDICLIMDDDETLDDNYEATILNAYKQHPDADVIAFKVRNSEKNYNALPKRLRYLGVLRVASYEISFRRDSVTAKGITFDTEMGSGTGHGGGEEVAFLYSCLHKGLIVRYVPEYISTLDPCSDSQWFKGFTSRFFLERGWATARYMGKPMAILYALYYTIRKYKMYSDDCSMGSAFTNTLKGIFIKSLP